MTRLLALLLLALPSISFGQVIITVIDPSEPMSCPQIEPPLRKNDDGTYTRSSLNQVLALACFTKESSHDELWTDYPENGGSLLKRIVQ